MSCKHKWRIYRLWDRDNNSARVRTQWFTCRRCGWWKREEIAEHPGSIIG